MLPEKTRRHILGKVPNVYTKGKEAKQNFTIIFGFNVLWHSKFKKRRKSTILLGFDDTFLKYIHTHRNLFKSIIWIFSINWDKVQGYGQSFWFKSEISDFPGRALQTDNSLTRRTSWPIGNVQKLLLSPKMYKKVP